MAKLYWRIKRNGKWTWIACSEQFLEHITDVLEKYGIPRDEDFVLQPLVEEEE